MKEYNLITRCLSTLKSSRMDVMTKLRMERLLSGIRTMPQVETGEQESRPDFEDLFRHVHEVCSGQSRDGVRSLVDHIRRIPPPARS